MQDSVAFELKTIHTTISIWTRLLILYCLSMWVVVPVLAIRLWKRLGLNSRKTLRALDDAAHKFSPEDQQGLISLASNFSEHQPERGLQEWGRLSAGDPVKAFRHIASRANGAFEFRIEQASIMLASLRKATLCLLGLTSLSCAVETLNLFRGVSMSKRFTTVVYLEGLTEIISLFAAAMFTALLAFAAHWHFSLRLTRRRNHWRYFISKALTE